MPFNCFRQLTHLSIQNCSITLKGRDAKREINFGPECLEELELSSLEYHDFEQPIIYFKKLSNLKKLLLHVNFLSKIDIVSFMEILNLEDLELSVNKYDLRKKNIFENFSKLKKLAIRGFSNVDERHFRNFPHLEFLYTLCCEYTDSIENTFSKLNKLTSLNLSNNKLENLDSNIFNHLNNLETLTIRYNPIKKLNSNLFKSFLKLEKIDLSHCSITCIHVNAFQGLFSLKRLNLKGNKLVDIKEETFKDVKGLQSLNLNKNPLKKLESNLFRGLIKLKTLRLRDCMLSEINGSTFEDLIECEALDLSNNRIEVINTGAFDHMKNLKYLNLSKLKDLNKTMNFTEV